MATKRSGRAVNFVMPVDLADALDRFVDSEPWTKTDALSSALYAFLTWSREQQLAALRGFRARQNPPRKAR